MAEISTKIQFGVDFECLVMDLLGYGEDARIVPVVVSLTRLFLSTWDFSVGDLETADARFFAVLKEPAVRSIDDVCDRLAAYVGIEKERARQLFVQSSAIAMWGNREPSSFMDGLRVRLKLSRDDFEAYQGAADELGTNLMLFANSFARLHPLGP